MEGIYNKQRDINQEVMTGTTIIAMKTSKGVILGSDTRTSAGNLIVSKLTNKLTKITDRIYCCRSGSAADTQVVAKMVRNMVKNIECEEYPKKITVKRVAHLFSKIAYKNPQLLMGIIIAGYDDIEKGSVYTMKLGGALIKQELSIGGSGSAFLYGYCDNEMENKKNMNDKEKFEFVKNSVKLAINRDGASGGCIRMATIDENGAEEFFFTIA